MNSIWTKILFEVAIMVLERLVERKDNELEEKDIRKVKMEKEKCSGKAEA